MGDCGCYNYNKTKTCYQLEYIATVLNACELVNCIYDYIQPTNCTKYRQHQILGRQRAMSSTDILVSHANQWCSGKSSVGVL